MWNVELDGLWRVGVVDSGDVVMEVVLYLHGSVLAFGAEHHDGNGAVT